MRTTELIKARLEGLVAEADVLGAVLVVKDRQGFHALSVTGVASHQEAVLMLANASHLVLADYESAVLGGLGGPEMQAAAESIRPA